MGATAADVDRAEALLKRAQQTSGLAAYGFFFVVGGPQAKAAYETALAAESEAEALLEAMRLARTLEAPAKPRDAP